jgi:isoquinoline 1-oxidoreductase beta subunit
MGTSAALLEEVTVKDGRVQTGNFDRYPLLRMAEAPDVETILLEAPDGKPRGLGEPPIGPIAPAIGNALFALAGVRLRRLPMTAEQVKAALGN